jgi:hypothetical protein
MAIRTPAQIREKVAALADSSKFQDEDLADFVATFTEIAVDYRGSAFEPTSTTEVHAPRYSRSYVVLRRPLVTAVTAVDVDGSALDVDDVTLYPDGRLELGVAGDVVTVTYTHGYASPPRRVVDACLEYVRAAALARRSEVSRDVIFQSSQGIVTRYSTPDPLNGRPTGWTEVDRLLNNLPDLRLPEIG